MTTLHREPRMRRLSDRLSPRERDVLRLWASGLSGAEIAVRLRITRGSLVQYQTRIGDKLGTERGLHGILAAAFERGYLRWSDDCPWFQ